MKTGTAGRQAALLSLAVLASAAQAQDLRAYRRLASAIDAANQSVGRDPLATLNHLDRAQQAYEALAPSIENKTLSDGLIGKLRAARAAQSRTPAELQAQLLLARGLMRRVLYDQLPQSLAGDRATAVQTLTREFALDGATAQALNTEAKNGQTDRVAWRLQRAAAGYTAQNLAQTGASKTNANYLNLTRATSWFTVVQDSARNLTPPLELGQFNAALGQLTAGDPSGLSNSLSRLRSGVKGLQGTLSSFERWSSTAPAVASPAPPVVVTPAQQASQSAPQPAPKAAPTPTPAPTTIQSGGGVDGAYAALGRALTAAGHSDLPRVRTELTRASKALAGAPKALRQTAGYADYQQALKAAAQRKGLRPTEVQALIAGLGRLQDGAAGRPQSALDRLSLGVAGGLGGPLRALLTLLLALLCAVPLYLLNLAFGGRNPYWRAIQLALGLLLAPTLLGGVFGFLGWLGDLMGVAPLRSLTNLTLDQGAYGLPLLLLLTALALGLATYGFRGLCVQFGLLGRNTQANPNPTPANPAQTSFDWDEELS